MSHPGRAPFHWRWRAPVLAVIFIAASGLGVQAQPLDCFNGFESGGAGDYRVEAGTSNCAQDPAPPSRACGYPLARTGQFGLLTTANGGANGYVSVPFSAPTSEFVDTIWMCVSNTPSPQARRIRSWLSEGEVIAELFLLTSNRVQLRVLDNPFGNLAVGICPNFSRVEVEYRSASAGGVAGLRVDGDGGSGTHEVDLDIDSTRIGPDDGRASSAGVIWDDHGIVLGTTFPDDLHIAGVLPANIGASNVWPPSGCTDKVACVGERPPDGNETFVFSSTTGNRQSFCMEPVSAAGVYGVILGVKSLAVAQGALPMPTMGLAFRLNAPSCGGAGLMLTSDFSQHTLTQQYTGVARIDTTGANPSGWTQAEINNAELLMQYLGGGGQANVSQVLREVAFDPNGSPSPTPSITPTSTSTPTRTPTMTRTNTRTFTPIPTATDTELPTFTPTHTNTATATVLPTSTPTTVNSATPTPSATPTETVETPATVTATPDATEEDTVTPTATRTSTATQIVGTPPTITPTGSPTASPTEGPPTPTGSITATETTTPTITLSPTATPTGPTPTPFPPRVDFILPLANVNETAVSCTQEMATDLGFGSALPQLSTLANPALSDPELYQEQYLVLYIAPGLTAADYTQLSQMSAPGGFIDRFVSLGGVAVINVAGEISASNIAPGGVDYTRTPAFVNIEGINTPSHQYLNGDAYNGADLDAASFTGWGPTDQGILGGLPANATVVLRRNEIEVLPTWVEYNHGAGRVIVTTLTYCNGGAASAGAALDNLLKYSRFFNGLAQTPGFTVTPTNTPTATATGPTRTPTNTRTPTRTPGPSLTPTRVPSQRGDFNEDGEVDELDLDELITMLFAEDPPAPFDLNDDDLVNAADVTLLLDLIVRF